MARTIVADAAFVDSSAIVALIDPRDQYHCLASEYLKCEQGIVWLVMNGTMHEAFTRLRYRGSFQHARLALELARSSQFELIRYDSADEDSAEVLLQRFSDHSISYHDALLSSLAMRAGVFRVFTFDNDFWILGHAVVPGLTRTL